MSASRGGLTAAAARPTDCQHELGIRQGTAYAKLRPGTGSAALADPRAQNSPRPLRRSEPGQVVDLGVAVRVADEEWSIRCFRSQLRRVCLPQRFPRRPPVARSRAARLAEPS